MAEQAPEATPGRAAPTAVDVPALMKDHVRLGAELRELTRVHETLLEEILCNADEDINGGDEAAEYLAEAYVRFLERERGELARIVGAARRPMTAEDLAPVLYEAWFATLAGGPWEAATWSELTPALSAAWLAATREALRITVADLRQAGELIRAQDDLAQARRELAEARAERNRYRKALEDIAERDLSALPRSFRDIARQALGGDHA